MNALKKKSASLQMQPQKRGILMHLHPHLCIQLWWSLHGFDLTLIYSCDGVNVLYPQSVKVL